MDDAEGRLRALSRFEMIVEGSPDIIAIIDRQYRHVYVNQAICAATGLTPADFAGRDHRELGMPEPMVEYFQSVYRHVFETGEEGAKEFEFPTPDGVRTYSSRVIPLREPDGRIEVVLSAARDITERKRAEEARLAMERKLQETQRLESLGLLAGGVAHDFNNLLTSIIGSVSIAKAQPAGASTVRAMLDDVESAALRAADLCMQMLAYAGRRQVHKEAVDPRALLRETAHLLGASASKNATIETSLPPDLPHVLADRGQAQQLAMNLLLNALESLPGGRGVVKVSAQVIDAAEQDWSDAIVSPDPASGALVEIEISDEGIGMDEATLARIFDPFFTTKLVGRGLGLAATLGIVRGHGGGLRVRSRVGRGTTFSLFLRPVSAPRASEPARSAAVRAATVLLVDDEPSVRGVVAMMLETEGHRVIACSDGESGVARFRAPSEPIDLALIDMTMPGIDGVETLSRLRETAPHLPAVLMSGYAAEEVGRRVVGDARTRFLQKPFRHPELIAAIDECLIASRGTDPRKE